MHICVYIYIQTSIYTYIYVTCMYNPLSRSSSASPPLRQGSPPEQRGNNSIGSFFFLESQGQNLAMALL